MRVPHRCMEHAFLLLPLPDSGHSRQLGGRKAAESRPVDISLLEGLMSHNSLGLCFVRSCSPVSLYSQTPERSQVAASCSLPSLELHQGLWQVHVLGSHHLFIHSFIHSFIRSSHYFIKFTLSQAVQELALPSQGIWSNVFLLVPNTFLGSPDSHLARISSFPLPQTSLGISVRTVKAQELSYTNHYRVP